MSNRLESVNGESSQLARRKVANSAWLRRSCPRLELAHRPLDVEDFRHLLPDRANPCRRPSAWPPKDRLLSVRMLSDVEHPDGAKPYSRNLPSKTIQVRPRGGFARKRRLGMTEDLPSEAPTNTASVALKGRLVSKLAGELVFGTALA